MLFTIFAIVIVQVFYRYVLNTGISWAEELSKMLLIWLLFLGFSIVFYEKIIIRVDFFINKIKKRKISSYFKIYHLLLSMIFFILLIVYGIDYTIFGKRLISTMMGIRKFWIFLAVPVGGLLLLIQNIILLINKDKK